ncbi:MAG TPA: elongation factor G [Defluviitaleaceae bacterium]|jgi:elongation factor G|nr:elongation factor G [Candidatus Epulonipiscium sp.]HOQ17074.1 elongation factor G [Defluviitaleaceae bacterium]HQD50332.1 elongation factor G [Defluviitaleaceae bacterium]
MKNYSMNQIRNVVLLGHGGCGKTTISEAMLYVSGQVKRQGKVDDGNTVSDYDPEEVKRKVSINTSIIPIEWKDHKINILDTPGYFDFVGEVKQAVRAADSAIIVVSAKSGVEVGTEKAWDYAEEAGLPKMIFINGMDDEHANMNQILEDLREKFGKSIAPFQVPFKENGRFAGFVNVVKMEGRRFVNGTVEPCEVPAGMDDEIAPVRNMILEAVAETSEELMEKYFNEEEFTPEEIDKALHSGVLDGSIVPVLCGSAIDTLGVRVLLNSILSYMPSPAEAKSSVEGKNPKTGETETRKVDENEPTSVFVFKTIVDPYIGRLSIFKVCSGVLKADSVLLNGKKDVEEKLSHIYVLKGKEQIEVSQLCAGDIGAVAKLQETMTGDTLSDLKKPIVYPEIEFPESLLMMAVFPKGKGDEDKMSAGLNRLMEEDPTFRVSLNKETLEQIMYGIGDQHLDVIVSKLKAKYKVEVELKAPTIPYRETIKAKVKVQGKHKKQTGGHGQYGDVWMEFEPSGDLNVPYVFEEKIFGGAVPKQYFPAVEKGLQESVKNGVLAGYPVVGLKATLVDGSYHPVDSSEMAFKMATSIAFKEGLKKAKPVILEPIVRVTVTVPDEYMGDVIGDLNKRRGKILGMNPKGKYQVVDAEVPLAEMYKYATDLRSMTQARGSFTMEFDRYEEAPMDVQEKVIEARKKEA